MMPLSSTDLPLPRIGRGKVRDIYAVGDDRLLLVATDRIRAFDVVMAEAIPLKGVVLTQISADAKFEFGRAPDGAILLIDEVMTPDSSRFWPAAIGPAARSRALTSSRCATGSMPSAAPAAGTARPPPPALPQEIVAATSDRYSDAFRRVTGKALDAAAFATCRPSR